MDAKQLTEPARVQSLLSELDWCVANDHAGPRTAQAIEHARTVLAALAPSDAAGAPSGVCQRSCRVASRALL
jgi:hypothetical protein